MATPDSPSHSPSVTLSLPRDEHWTLHHVLLDWLEQRAGPAQSTSADADLLAVVHAFETLDTGETDFTLAQLDAIQQILAEYHHATTWWELERAHLEQLLHRVSDCIDQYDAALTAD